MNIAEHIHLLNPTKKERCAYHLGFWFILLALRLYLTGITFNVYSGFPIHYQLLLNFSGTILIAAVYYLLIGPVWHWTRQGLWMRAVFGVTIIVIFYTALDTLFELMITRSCPVCLFVLKSRQADYYGLLQSGLINVVLKRLLSLGTPFTLFLTLSIPLSIKMALRGWRSQVNALQLAREIIELEFNFLKAQVNPHFLFNTLNNIYGLILKEDTISSADMVARLSGLLRYMLYETDVRHMPLSKEIQLMKDYVELEKVRLNETQVKMTIQTDASDYTVPPLLLIPLLENAFKFCPDEPGAYINLFLDVLQNSLRVTLVNTVDAERIPATGNGIGQANFRKRLDLYYPGHYNYQAELQDEIYTVNLSIDLI